MLEKMEKGLDLRGAYEGMLRRIKAQDGGMRELGMTVLMWITHSRRELRLDELLHALAARTKSTEFNGDYIESESTILACCQGLVTIEKDTSNIRLIHETVQKHLGEHPDLFDKAHSKMAEACLTYLNFERVKNLSVDTPPNFQNMHFLKYSSIYWGTHMREEHSDRAEESALELLENFNCHISSKLLWQSIVHESANRLSIWLGDSDADSDDEDESAGAGDGKGFSALHCVSYFGIAEVARKLIGDVNKMDDGGMTPLMWTVICGHEGAAKYLLDQDDIQRDQRSRIDDRTALSWAAGCGHLEVVKLLLPESTNRERIGRVWGASLVAGLVSRRYVNPDSCDKYGRTPLSWAAGNGHQEIVKLLLKRKDVNPKSLDTGHYRTPLSWAAMNDQKGTLKLLLGKGVDPDTPDPRFGRTPLSLAAENGCEGTLKLLLGKGVNPNARDTEYGRTPLAWAAEAGHERIVELLLDRKDVSPDTPDTFFGQTPLSWAAQNGHERVVELLLHRKDVNPNAPEKESGLTPLDWAVLKGHGGVVKLLLRKGVNPDTQNPKSGRTPLSVAAEQGHEGIVKLLLDREDVNPNTPDTKYGLTPVLLAAMGGHQEIVKLLLGRNDIKPDTPETAYGKTPLAWAAEDGHEGVVALLLERKDVNPDFSSKSGETPLTLATKNGHSKVVELLQAHNSRRAQ